MSNESKESKGTSKGTSKVSKVSKECCSVCADTYTSMLRRKCICKYCNVATCSKCIERYLLDRHEDAHCLHCRVNYNDNALHEICTKTYIRHTYFKHRQEVLINRERANLPGLQDIAIVERKKRDDDAKISAIKLELQPIELERDKIMVNYNREYSEHYSKNAESHDRKNLDELIGQIENYRIAIQNKREEIANIRMKTYDDTEEKEKRKFIRRCTIDNCQGFLSTAWKCGICEYYSCSKCFTPKTKKYDDPHECSKDDLDTAELIKKDCKPCPNCGEFIMKSSGCDQMWCLSCKTPWSWVTGKVVTSGPIHNPHYYEWMRRNGTAPRNPADVPCGGYPGMHDLRKIPKPVRNADDFFEFYRICCELQDISERTYRSHIDNNTNAINIKFLLGDFDEKHWGQQLAKNERKRKRDAEVQEIFAAFRMVAVELINRVQNYNQRLSAVPTYKMEKFIADILVEVAALINMINDALCNISISYSYSVPYICFDKYYYIKTKRFDSNDISKITAKKYKSKELHDTEVHTEVDTEEIQLQTAIHASLL